MRLLPILFSLIIVVGCKPKQPVRTPVLVSEDTTFLTGTFYIIRHAERNPGPDSTLTAAGLQRAGALYALLKDSGLNKIYLTHYKRSIGTADSLRLRLHLDTCFYKADTSGESLIYEITRHEDWGKRLLVIGHANTLIPILHSLRAKPRIDSIGDKEYDRLFIVRKNREGTTLKEICY
ncbi:histidine phosphatase superfamily protein (branch 1) [Chitinophaga niastensis]|uniref:Histidine phosphatase superfamily protein (Branch 1) n=1 Tax=Chitinophaga niastensis TaxID=536980 RepID=A0A2P8HKM4_CHINA|nr:histidine phosphatase family protein [Chitinophaga niastensis]PSL46774.1 histidine phosphatase superfamily protein (branch 1) [Chitinophaga niastensis]